MSAVDRETSPAAPVEFSPCDRRDTLLAASFAMAAIAMSITASGVALVQVDVGDAVGMTHLQWIMNGFILTFAALLLPIGSLADRIGERKLFLIGAVLFATATLAAVCASSFIVLMIGRLLQGCGAAFLAAAGPPALTTVFQNEGERKRVFGYLGMSGGIGLTLGGFFAGVVATWGGWRAAFALHLPLVIAALVIAARGFRGKRGSAAGRFDLRGALLCCTCITAAMTFGISGGAQGWTAPFVLLAGSIAMLAGCGFVAAESMQSPALVDFSIFHNRQFLLACLVCVLFTTVWVALFIYVPLNIRTVQGRTGFDAGTTMLALMVPALIMPIIATRLAQHVDSDSILFGGFVLMSAGLLTLWTAWSGELHRDLEIIGLIVSGAGAGSLYGLVDYLALAAVPADRSGVASGAFNLLRLAGDALGSIIPGAVLLHGVREGLAGTDPEISRATLNEVAAGRFAAVVDSSLEPIRAELLIERVTAHFSAGMNDALFVLFGITVAGAIAVVAMTKTAYLQRTAARCSCEDRQ